jgi:hypothetical protein
MKKTKLALLALMATLGIGCGSANHFSMPIENYFGAGIGAIMPGRGKEQDMPSVTAGEFDYRAKFNENWSAGMSIKFGKGSESTSANVPLNIPSTESTIDTRVYNPYIQWQKRFGKRNEVSVRAGLSIVDQDRHTTIGAPIDDQIHLAGNAVGGSIGAKYQCWNQNEDTAAYVKIESDFINGKNISSTTTATTGVEFKLD